MCLPVRFQWSACNTCPFPSHVCPVGSGSNNSGGCDRISKSSESHLLRRGATDRRDQGSKQISTWSIRRSIQICYLGQVAYFHQEFIEFTPGVTRSSGWRKNCYQVNNIYIYICRYTFVYAHMYIYIYMHIYIHLNVHIYVYTYACMRVCVYVCM